jgi:hypothetical protein
LTPKRRFSEQTIRVNLMTLASQVIEGEPRILAAYPARVSRVKPTEEGIVGESRNPERGRSVNEAKKNYLL